MSRFEIPPAGTPSTRNASPRLRGGVVVRLVVVRGLYVLGPLQEVLRERGLAPVADGGAR